MQQSQSEPALSTSEFVALMALIISLVALSIDSMLPALPFIAADLGLIRPNDAQFVISVMFLGFAVGQVVFGSVSDSIGRKPAIYIGIGVFLVGCALSLLATDFSVMLIGRALQGFGAASPRIVSTAMIRDQYRGREMARIVSMIMTVFIIVPAIAPAVGQTILAVSHWRVIFALLMVQAAVAVVWLALRQPETLVPANRRALSRASLREGALEVLRNRVAMGYTVMSGLVSGAFVGYLISAQQVFQDLYKVGERFPWYFGTLAVGMGISSALNSRLVMQWGSRSLAYWALSAVCVLAVLFGALAFAMHGRPPLLAFMAYMMLSFLCIGSLFGNFNAMAMEPLGRVAGMGAAMVGAMSTLVSLSLGTVIGQSYNGTVMPIVGGFVGLAAAALMLMRRIDGGVPATPIGGP